MSESPPYPPGKVSGSCACQRITFETTTLPKDITSCYCKECAKTGCGFISFAHFLEPHIKWTKEPDIWKSSTQAERGFCKQCGSTIFFRDYIDKGEISIATSTIDASSAPLPRSNLHIFLEEKADWVPVPDDGSERFDGHHPKFLERMSRQQQGAQ